MTEDEIRALIKPPGERRSVAACITIGQWWVNGPVGLLMFSGLLAAIGVAFIVPQGAFPGRGLVAGICGVGGWVAAWTWWSWAIPRWRIWALCNVTDWRELKERAVAVKLTWPDGHIFEKTEIRSAKQREIERTLRRIRESEV